MCYTLAICIHSSRWLEKRVGWIEREREKSCCAAHIKQGQQPAQVKPYAEKLLAQLDFVFGSKQNDIAGRESATQG